MHHCVGSIYPRMDRWDTDCPSGIRKGTMTTMTRPKGLLRACVLLDRIKRFTASEGKDSSIVSVSACYCIPQCVRLIKLLLSVRGRLVKSR